MKRAKRAVPVEVTGPCAQSSNINYLYFAWYIRQFPRSESLKVLDFGCGRGEVVSLLRGCGIDCYGADVYIEGTSYRELCESVLFKQGIIRRIDANGAIPFDAGFFDVIVSNQVLEHVPDLAAAVDSMERVLSPSGIMYHHFPSKEVWREGHIGIPLAHRLPRNRFRFCYTLALRSLGLGFGKAGRTRRDWARAKLDWIDAFCFYRPYASVVDIVKKRFVLKHREIDYCLFRAQNSAMLSRVLRMPLMRPLYEEVFRRLGFMAIELRRRVPG